MAGAISGAMAGDVLEGPQGSPAQTVPKSALELIRIFHVNACIVHSMKAQTACLRLQLSIIRAAHLSQRSGP